MGPTASAIEKDEFDAEELGVVTSALGADSLDVSDSSIKRVSHNPLVPIPVMPSPRSPVARPGFGLLSPQSEPKGKKSGKGGPRVPATKGLTAEDDRLSVSPSQLSEWMEGVTGVTNQVANLREQVTSMVSHLGDNVKTAHEIIATRIDQLSEQVSHLAQSQNALHTAVQRSMILGESLEKLIESLNARPPVVTPAPVTPHPPKKDPSQMTGIELLMQKAVEKKEVPIPAWATTSATVSSPSPPTRSAAEKGKGKEEAPAPPKQGNSSLPQTPENAKAEFLRKMGL